ncbi:MAG: hypothetical protein A2033_02850 [Bacteroidetes bacterium GWA2_31_9]|nr:MAG: hypothetical protein A2033_02850 [Bacteroidetes bacterium GWA2_31_9]
MADNLFKWNFEKNEENFIYDTLKKLAESLKLESDGIFVPIVTIGDLSDNSRTYAFHIGVPELSGFTWRIFEINTKNSTRFSEIIFPSSIKGAKSFKISSKENLIETINQIINEKEIQLELSTYYNRVITKRKQKVDFRDMQHPL